MVPENLMVAFCVLSSVAFVHSGAHALAKGERDGGIGVVSPLLLLPLGFCLGVCAVEAGSTVNETLMVSAGTLVAYFAGVGVFRFAKDVAKWWAYVPTGPNSGC